MDYSQTITVLKQQRLVLDETIAALERLATGGPPPFEEPKIERRGRKGMDPQEREMVSIRMRNYWAARRSGKTHHAGAAS
jgi:hypothetical protein